MNDSAFERLAFGVFKQSVKDYRVNPEKFADAEEYTKTYIDTMCNNIDSDVFMQKLKERRLRVV